MKGIELKDNIHFLPSNSGMNLLNHYICVHFNSEGFFRKQTIYDSIVLYLFDRIISFCYVIIMYSICLNRYCISQRFEFLLVKVCQKFRKDKIFFTNVFVVSIEIISF